MPSPKTVTIELTRVELEHVLSALYDSVAERNYYGNPEQYWMREARIIRKLEAKREGDDV